MEKGLRTLVCPLHSHELQKRRLLQDRGAHEKGVRGDAPGHSRDQALVCATGTAPHPAAGRPEDAGHRGQRDRGCTPDVAGSDCRWKGGGGDLCAYEEEFDCVVHREAVMRAGRVGRVRGLKRTAR